MNEEAISYIMQKMSNCLDNSQMVRLEKPIIKEVSFVDFESLAPVVESILV